MDGYVIYKTAKVNLGGYSDERFNCGCYFNATNKT